MAYRFKHGDRPIEGYAIQRAVGAGGFGEVYYAMSDGGREVALKYLRDNPQVELRGVAHCINLKSPHLISIFDVKKSVEDEYFLVMEYISGPSLRDLLIAEPNGFSPEKSAFFVREIAKGLAYLHDRGIVHRDLKPGNIFYDDGYVKIGDYGLSKFISVSRHSAQTASVGTVHYMAPEIGSGDYSRGVDIYALGVILYEMLLGKVPFEGSSMGEVLMKHLMSQPQVDDLPEPFGRVIRRALEKNPKDRYQTVDEMVSEILSGEVVQKSLAGFSPDSLSAAVRRGAADRAPSPVPSPNPAPRRGGFGSPFEETLSTMPLPDHVGGKMDRISRKIERKLVKFGGKFARRGEKAVNWRGQNEPSPARRSVPDGEGSRKKRLALCVFLTVATAFGVGALIGNMIKDEVGASAGMLVAAMTGSVPLRRWVIRWLGTEAQPIWVQRLVSLVCSAPLIFVGAAPMLDNHDYQSAGLAAALGLLAISVFGDWSKEIEHGVVGDLKIWTAVWTGFVTFVITSMLSGPLHCDPRDCGFIAALVAAVASFNIQASSWWLRGYFAFAPAPGGQVNAGGEQAYPQRPAMWGAMPMPAADYQRTVNEATVAATPVAPQPIRDSQMPGPPFAAAQAMLPFGRVIRGVALRMFWALAAFLLMSGGIVTLMLAIFERSLSHGAQAGLIFGCIGSGSMMLFCLSKTTPMRWLGIWRNVVRPFLTCWSLSGIGVFITLIATNLAPDGLPAFIVGLVLVSILFLGLLVSRFLPRKRIAAPFFHDDGSGYPSPTGSAAAPVSSAAQPIGNAGG